MNGDDIQELAELLADLPAPKWRPGLPHVDTWVRPEWMTDAMMEHPGYRCVSRAELRYFETTGRVMTGQTRARLGNDPWFCAHVERTGRLPHTSMRARQAARTALDR